MNFRNALVAATMLSVPLAANAQPLTGLYIGGGAGVNIMHNEDMQVGAPGSSNQLKSRVGPAFDLAVGFRAPFGLRVELEGAYRYNTFSSDRIGGQEQKFGPMVNVLYDVVGLTPLVQPYVGVGAGYQWVQERNLRSTGPAAITRLATDSEGKFAYQAIIGAALPLSQNFAVTADYRFMGLVGDRSYAATNTTAAGVTTATTATLNNNFNHTVLIGFRYTFGATAPAPAAPAAAEVPASPVSRSYLVFFDWDKATLTDRARQIVSEAAANSTKVQYTQLEVNGYTDTSGSAKYNQGLSVRRAQAVAAELVKDGVPKSAIAIQGFGETHLLVPTGEGVREPQNRRVEIIIK